jgi:hypothetical protein
LRQLFVYLARFLESAKAAEVERFGWLVCWLGPPAALQRIVLLLLL